MILLITYIVIIGDIAESLAQLYDLILGLEKLLFQVYVGVLR